MSQYNINSKIPSACLPRLKREIVELYNEPLKGIKVKLHDNDITSMCLILTSYQGPFSNLRLHCKVNVPEAYPQVAPNITIQTQVTHPNISEEGSICADILQACSLNRDSQHYNGGYTPGYLLKYIFLQLLSFFSDNNVEQWDGHVSQIHSDLENFRKQSEIIVRGYQCKLCGFNDGTSSIALMPVLNDEELQREMDEIDASGSSIISSVNPRVISVDSTSYTSTATVNDLDDVLIQRQLVCYFLRKTFEECVLGIGVNVGRGRADKRELTISGFDFFSYEAFKNYDLRQGIWGDGFTNFLPIALHQSHFKRALPIIQLTLMELREEGWNSSIILKTIPSLMNTTAVALMNSCKEGAKGLKASEKALQGYCLLLHLLLMLSKQFPEVVTEAENKVNAFMHPDRKNRHKSSIPNLGEFMIYLFLTKNISWSEFITYFLEELFSRKVVWLLNDAPELAFLEQNNYVSKYRLEKTFELGKTSLRLVMFQVAFFKMMKGKEEEMDRRYGYPSNELSASLLSLIKKIYAVKDWNVFFDMIDFPLPKEKWESDVCGMLINAVKESENSEYHQNPYTNIELFSLRSSHEPDDGWSNNINEASKKTKYEIVQNLTFFPGDRNRKENEDKRISFDGPRNNYNNYNARRGRYNNNRRNMGGRGRRSYGRR